MATAAEYNGVEDYTKALSKASWKLTELIAKQSFGNGIAKGKAA